ncbi:MAG: ABC transporter ATP-binding protein [Campylobacterota bacterium]|nr:ABC transporter ATP-binding protein [Campylobacterota bacterium]
MIEIINLNKVYNENKKNQFKALKDINLIIETNQLVLLKGVSGSGKSTLLSIIASFTKPTSGDIKVLDEQIAKLPDSYISQFRQDNIGFVFQDFNLFEQLSVEQNLIPSLVLQNLSKTEISNKINKVLKTANIISKRYETVSNLSGGEKQRVAIARALVNDADIVLCDEPTANLDKKNSLLFIDILKELKLLNKTIIISTHDTIFDNLNIVDKKYILEDGKIIS